jgi:hypothetical protein
VAPEGFLEPLEGASSEQVARIYEGVAFRRVGTARIVE